MAVGTEIRIDGLREFQAAMRAVDKNLPKELRLMFNDVVKIIADAARPMVPSRTGTAAASIKPQSTQRMGQVKAGGSRASYYAWLDFGGSVGRQKSVHRPFLKRGRYLFVAYEAHKPAIEAATARGITELMRKSGLAVH
jgi:hypothetical protein